MKSRILCALLTFLLVSCSLADRYSLSTPAPTLAPTNAVTPTVTFVPPISYSVTTDLTKRTCPSVSCASIGFYTEGDVVLVDGWLYDVSLDECQSWAHIANETHWVCANYLIEK